MNENKRQEISHISRRKFLKDGLLAVGLVLLTPMAFLNACKNTSNTPKASIKVPAKGVSDGLTTTTDPPVSQISSQASPISNVDSSSMNYSLSVDGLVNNPLTINYDSLLQFPSVTKTVTLTCPGVFEETSEWTGVPLLAVLNAAGIKSEASQVMITDSSGYGAPFSVQEEAVTSGDILLAFKYNGQGLPADRGYPVRLVVPGSDGTAWVKGVTHIRLVQ